jgi:hypothetical protein
MDEWRSVKRAVFARHGNPWSAWTRWASTPLMLVPVWRRSWRDGALVGVWKGPRHDAEHRRGIRWLP